MSLRPGIRMDQSASRASPEWLLPTNALKPTPKIVRARPEATWLATRVIVRKAKTSAIPVPRQQSDTDPEPRAAGLRRYREGRDRTYEHHAFHAEVKDSRSARRPARQARQGRAAFRLRRSRSEYGRLDPPLRVSSLFGASASGSQIRSR